MTPDEFKRIDRIVKKAQDEDLSQWDSDFIGDMADRLGEYGENTTLTIRQHEQINRIEEQYRL